MIAPFHGRDILAEGAARKSVPRRRGAGRPRQRTLRFVLAAIILSLLPFDQHYMNELYKVGYDLGKSGYPWAKSPPGY